MSATSDVIVIGAGVVGAACAMRLAEAGLTVRVIEAGCAAGGATGAGMGHICLIDDSQAQFELSRFSQLEWASVAAELPRSAEYERCGTIWLATDAEQMAAVDRKVAEYTRLGISAEKLDSRALREAEPRTRENLMGGLLLPEDAIVYAPVATRWMLDRAAARGAKIETYRRALSAARGVVVTDDGDHASARHIVCATGIAAAALVPGVPVRPRKGHLIITARAEPVCRHQLVELAYIANAHGHSDESVSFNVQPRRTGQLLIGSSRQYGAATAEVEPRMIAMLLRRAAEYVPSVLDLTVLRCWTGFRAATPDSLPIIGALPGDPTLVLATGHEGLGLTTSLGTARLVAAHITGTTPPFAPEPYEPARFGVLREGGGA